MFSSFFFVLSLFIQPAEAATPMQIKRLIAVVQQTGLETNTIISGPDLVTLFKASIYDAEAPKCGVKTVITTAIIEPMTDDNDPGAPLTSLHIATEIYPGRMILMMDLNADGAVDSMAPSRTPLSATTQTIFDELITCALTPQ